MLAAPSRLVLVADDTPVLAILLAALVEQSGGQVLGPSANGIDALSLFQAAHPDAAVLDINMPGLDGMQVLEAIRADRAGSRCFVVVVTANDDPTYRERCRALGVDHFLLKTVELFELPRLLQEHWRRQAAART